uniref:Ras-associating domain-containing protein n=1 Tax=Ursus maritimus TaxID=29073 RepID=A0A452TPA8_URSMA
MFYGTHFIMSPPTKSKLKRQSQLLSSVLSRTLSYKYRDLDTTFSSLGASDDPAELSTQLSAPGVLKVFGDSVCTGTHYKSVLATGMSSAQELVKEALERYALSPECASQYVLCDVVGQAGDSGQQWQAECFRVFGDNEKPLLIQELWKPREGLSRRFELRKRSDVEELAAKDVDTMTAGINAQARRLQRNRAKGTPALASGGARSPPTPRLRRTVSESSLSSATAQDPEERGQDTMRYSLYESPHLLLLQGYSQQHVSPPPRGPAAPRELTRRALDVLRVEENQRSGGEAPRSPDLPSLWSQDPRGPPDASGVSSGLLSHCPSLSEGLFPFLCSAPGKRWVWGVSPGCALDRVGKTPSGASPRLRECAPPDLEQGQRFCSPASVVTESAVEALTPWRGLGELFGINERDMRGPPPSSRTAERAPQGHIIPRGAGGVRLSPRP